MLKSYKVNEENDTVVGFMDAQASRLGYMNEIVDRCSTLTAYIALKLMDFLPVTTNPTFKSVSKCTKPDVFDVRVGKDIAGAKSDAKYHHHMTNKYHSLRKILAKADRELRELEEFHAKKEKNIKDDLDRYFN